MNTTATATRRPTAARTAGPDTGTDRAAAAARTAAAKAKGKTAPAATPTAPAAAKVEKAAPKAPKVAPLCGCGCEVRTVRPEARYLAGHDARHAGQVGRQIAAGADREKALATLPTPALRAKAAGFADRVQRLADEKVARKVATEAAKQAAKAAYDAALGR